MKTAILIGSSGNLGPIWQEQLEQMDYKVFCMDISNGYSVRQDLYFDLFVNEVLGDNIPHVVLYNAAVDNPPSDGVTFFTNVDDVVDVNLLGAVRACKKFLPMMINNGGGIFVYVSSIQSVVGADWRNYDGDFQKPVGYNISKAGINQLVRSIAVQFGRKNIRAVSIGFAAVDTGKFKEPFKGKFLSCLPLGRFISPESCKKTLKAAIEIPELTGQLVMVDGGYTAW